MKILRVGGLSALLLLAFVVLVFAPAAAKTSEKATAHQRPADLSDLPVSAQAPISAALGQDNPAYHFQPIADGWRARQMRQGLEIDLEADGLVLRTADHRLALKLVAWGNPKGLRPVSPSLPQTTANRLAYAHGRLTEWYLNGPLGLEQGFSIEGPPDTPSGLMEKDDRGLTLALAVTTDLDLRLDADKKGITLSRPHGQALLRYGGLTAFDAAGKELPAWLELEGEASTILHLHVDDRGAVYPLTIDPWIQSAKLTDPNGAAFDQFGYSVAVSGDTAVVGAYGNNLFHGAAYVFIRPVSGWAAIANFSAKLTASDGAVNDYFGVSVAVSGDTVVVGADGNLARGAAYVFVKPINGWATTNNFNAKLTASDGVDNDRFGYSVAVSGDTALVGAYGAGLIRGAAYIFVKSSGDWATTNNFNAKLTASDGVEDDNFGFSVALSGDTAVVAAYGHNLGSGAAYVFVKPISEWATTNAFSAKLAASDGAAGDNFGFSAAVSGDTVIVGSPYDQIGSNSSQGSAYIFVKPPGDWATTNIFNAKLTASDGATYDNFGVSVAISGLTALVGAYGNALGRGAAYLFDKPVTGWTTTNNFTAKLTASDGATDDNFGVSVAISSLTALVGAYYDAIGTNTDQGSAYVFTSGTPSFFSLFLPLIMK